MGKIITILFLGFMYSLTNPWANLNIASNSQDFSLSRSNISSGSVGFYQFSNPALLPKTNKFDYGFCYNRMSLDRSTQVISLNFRLPPKAGIGISLMRSGTANIQGKDMFNNDTSFKQDQYTYDQNNLTNNTEMYKKES